MEFDLIRRYFKEPFGPLAIANRQTVLAGIGDDCAALQPSKDHALYISTDTLVEGVHFFSDDTAQQIGWKSLACNLSDLAASGAGPLGFTLNISLPKVDESWLSGFSKGLHTLATRENCPLLGGDTTSAGMNQAIVISITVIGQAPLSHTGFHRSQAVAGDDIWVSGTPGLARLGLLLEYQRRGSLKKSCPSAELADIEYLLAVFPRSLKKNALHALQYPLPRLQLGSSLRGLANACVDLSDGLNGDAGHIANASGLAVQLSVSAVEALWIAAWPSLSGLPERSRLLQTLLNATWAGGDDFELCWTASPAYRTEIEAAGLSAGCSVACIGRIEEGEGVWIHSDGTQFQRLSGRSYNHFPEPEL